MTEYGKWSIVGETVQLKYARTDVHNNGWGLPYVGKLVVKKSCKGALLLRENTSPPRDFTRTL